MSRKIIGITVGTQLPKPNFKQTDPTKGDYIRNKPDFEGLKSRVDTISDLVGDTSVSTQIATKLNKDELPTAINTALAQAKESGEFDGYAPVRGTDYWTEADKNEIKSYIDQAILGGEW